MTAAPPSMFDSSLFNERLFFPREDDSEPPPGATDLRLEVAPDVTLHARWHRGVAQPPKATFIVFHGNGEIVADYDAIARQYHEDIGADVMIVDFRGYGQSEGESDYRNCIADAIPAVKSAKAQMGDAATKAPVIALGRSLGGACAASIAAANPPVVDAIVMESSGSDPQQLIARRGLPSVVLTAAETAFFDPRPKLAACKLPVLVLHGADDEIIAPKEARENYAMLTTSTKRLVFVPNHGHNNLWADESYWEALAAFAASVRDLTR